MMRLTRNDDEESSGDEESSQDEGEGGLEGSEDETKDQLLDDGLGDGATLPVEWHHFTEMPQFPTPPIEVPTFDCFTDNWGGAILSEEQDFTWICVGLLCLGVFLLWFAYVREDSLLG